MRRQIEASREGLVEFLRSQAQQHRDAADVRGSTRRQAERQKGIAEGLDMAAKAVEDTTFVDEEHDDAGDGPSGT